MCETLSDDQFEKQVQKAINSSCRMLAIREHSIKELRLKLVKKGFSSKVLDKSIEWVLQENWLSEERYCGSYIRGKVAKGQGRHRIEAELQQQNIDELVIANSFEDEAIDWQQLCHTVANKKLASLTSSNANQHQVQPVAELDWQELSTIKMKLERFLRYRGFAQNEITTTIRQCFSKQESI